MIEYANGAEEMEEKNVEEAKKKRKEKESGGEGPHVGYIANVTGNMKITYSPKK